MGARVVLDSNILVSALGWRGRPFEIVRRCLDRHDQLLLSPALLEELERVLRYPKLKFEPSAILDYLEALTEVAELVEPRFRLSVVEADPSDDRFLECAIEGGAHAIVTGDRHLLDLGTFEGIAILSAESFVRRFPDE